MITEDEEEGEETEEDLDEGDAGGEVPEVYYFGPVNPGQKTKLRQRKPIATRNPEPMPARTRDSKALEIEEVDLLQERCDRRVAESTLPSVDMLDLEVSLDKMMKQLESLKEN